jgi:hypothetical protein
VFFHHPDARKLSGIAGVRRRNEASKGNRDRFGKYKPPMPLIEFRDGGAIKEGQAVQVCQGVRNVVVLPIHLANPVHRPRVPHCRIVLFSVQGNTPFVTIEDSKILAVGCATDAGVITLNYVSPDTRFRGVGAALA